MCSTDLLFKVVAVIMSAVKFILLLYIHQPEQQCTLWRIITTLGSWNNISTFCFSILHTAYLILLCGIYTSSTYISLTSLSRPLKCFSLYLCSAIVSHVQLTGVILCFIPLILVHCLCLSVSSPLWNASRLPSGPNPVGIVSGESGLSVRAPRFLEKVHSHLIKLIIVPQNAAWSLPTEIHWDK